MYKPKRNLDGIYFRVKRDGKWDNVCFTDLTDEEITELFDNPEKEPLSAEWWRSVAMILRECIQTMGDFFDIVASYGDAEE